MSVQATTETREQDRVLSTINSFSILADRSAFEYLGALFADEVLVDYTSAFGGEPARVNRTELMRQWAGLLPGFDSTHHQLSDIRVSLSGDSADVTAGIIARHYLGDQGFWEIAGSYRFELIRQGQQWQIRSLTLNAGEERGSREVLGQAADRAAEGLKEKRQRLLNWQP